MTKKQNSHKKDAIEIIKSMVWIDDKFRQNLIDTVMKLPEDRCTEAIEAISSSQVDIVAAINNWIRNWKKIIWKQAEEGVKSNEADILNKLEQDLIK